MRFCLSKVFPQPPSDSLVCECYRQEKPFAAIVTGRDVQHGQKQQRHRISFKFHLFLILYLLKLVKRLCSRVELTYRRFTLALLGQVGLNSSIVHSVTQCVSRVNCAEEVRRSSGDRLHICISNVPCKGKHHLCCSSVGPSHSIHSFFLA